jgi:hypothetical protein
MTWLLLLRTPILVAFAAAAAAIAWAAAIGRE